MANILGFDIQSMTLKDTAISLTSRLFSGERGIHIVTANAEIIYKASIDDTAAKVLKEASALTADGIGTVKAASIINEPVPERVTGIDLMGELLALADSEVINSNAEVRTVFLLGAKPEVIEAAHKNLSNKFPHVMFNGYKDGYWDKSLAKEVAIQIGNLHPDYLFVGMGFPFQDQFLEEYKEILDYGIAMGVGGSFDVYSGMIERAPNWVQKAGVEWLYRAIKDPSRAKRLSVLPKFIFKVYMSKNKKNK